MDHDRYPSMHALYGFAFPVYASAGMEQRAHHIAGRCERAHRFLADTLRARADLTVLVLAPEDWRAYTTPPRIYGMPHYPDAWTLAVAGENNEFWRSQVPPLDVLPLPVADTIRFAYGQPDGSLDLSPFFDLLAVHELSHLFHEQSAWQPPRLWLMELFCNLCLHAYTAVQEPDQLTALETLPDMIVSLGHAHHRHHTLEDFERLYTGVGPDNYGWYQCRLHVAARLIYDAGGIAILQRLWSAFSLANGTLSDQELAAQLRADVSPEVERVWTTWPE
jgi:hypothetical protein